MIADFLLLLIAPIGALVIAAYVTRQSRRRPKPHR